MASGFAGAGLVLLVVGILAVTAGLAMAVFTQEDQEANEEGFFEDRDRTEENDRQGRLGQTIAVGGGAVAFLGLVFIVIGRAD